MELKNNENMNKEKNIENDLLKIALQHTKFYNPTDKNFN